ncbi:hypothetical protein D3C78_1562960 [compost metagenome]
MLSARVLQRHVHARHADTQSARGQGHAQSVLDAAGRDRIDRLGNLPLIERIPFGHEPRGQRLGSVPGVHGRTPNRALGPSLVGSVEYAVSMKRFR